MRLPVAARSCISIIATVTGLAFAACAQVAPAPAPGVTLSPTTDPVAASPVVQEVSVSGTGFPSGPITASQVTVTITPPPGNGAAVPFAASSVLGSGSARTVVFRIPQSLTSASPIPGCAVTIAGSKNRKQIFSSLNSARLTINPPARISNISPGAGVRGSSTGVTIAGIYSNFAPNITSVSAGAGITVSNVVVSSKTLLTATLNIDAAAITGPRDITVTTGAEAAVLTGGFLVSANQGLALASITPNSAPQGQLLDVGIVGTSTHFAAVSTIANFGDGIQVNSVTVDDSTHLRVNIAVSQTTYTGWRAVTLVTGGEFAASSQGFNVTASSAALVSVVPGSGAQSSTVTVALTGSNTHFLQDATIATFGEGINSGNVRVNSPTAAEVDIAISPAAVPGPRTVTATTFGEIASLANAFAVVAATPIITAIAPPSGAQGQTLAVNLTGAYTNFQQSTTTANFGESITVNSLTVNSPTSVTVNITISPLATVGARTVTLRSGVTDLATTFSVTASGASIASVAPNSGPQGTSMPLAIVGSGTHWAQGTTTASFDPAFAPCPPVVDRITINDATHAEVDITIPACSPVGAHTLFMNTGGEGLSAGFTVTASTPSVTVVPMSGMTGATVPVTFAGQFSHFDKRTTTVVVSGEGVQIRDFTVGSATRADARLVISPTAPAAPANPCAPGNRTFTLTTPLPAGGSEILTAPFCVVPSALTDISPASSLRNQALTVAITGLNTHFSQRQTTVGFGPNIAVKKVTVASPTSLSASIAIGAAAALGPRNVFVNTGTEQLTIGFTVVSAALTQVSPASGAQGQTLTVAITGQGTNFQQGVTQPILGAGVTVNSLTVNSPTSATAQIAISPTTWSGLRDVVMMTWDEIAVGSGLFSVTQGVAQIAQVSPSAVQQGQVVDIALTGQATHWLQGGTTADFGPGIFVNSLTINGVTSASAQITVASTAPLGLRGVSLITDGEVAPSASNALNVQQGAPALLSVSPTSARQGETLNVQVLGVNTHWTTVTTASFGDGVTVNSFTATNATTGTINITVQPTAMAGTWETEQRGWRNVTVTTGGEQVSLLKAFWLDFGPAVLTSVTPNSAAQGQTLVINVTGQETHFASGVTTACLARPGATSVCNDTGGGINTGAVTVSSATTASVSISVAQTAPPGLRTVYLFSRGEIAAAGSGFTVTAGQPTLNSVSPSSAQQGQTIPLSIIGQFTHWVQGTTTATFGQGITLQSLTINSETSASATVAIDSLAYVGSRIVTFTTGGEIVSSALFRVQSGPAILNSISPTRANQGQRILLQIRGLNTHWSQGLTQFSIGGAGYDVTVNSFVVNNASSATADLTVQPIASLGTRTVLLSTGGENAALPDGFVVTGGVPAIAGISPDVVRPGDTGVNVQIAGLTTAWTPQSAVDFGPGITVTNYSVNSSTSITAVINVDAAASLDVHTVTVRTGAQVLTGSIEVANTTYLRSIHPWAGLPGQTFSVSIEGANTRFNPATTGITFGAGISVNTFQVTGQTTAVANITISPDASLGPRTVTITTPITPGDEVVSTGFYVVDGIPTLVLVDPGSGMQGTTKSINIVGQYTTFDATTVFDLGPGVTVNSKTIFGPTSAGLSISIAILAPLTSRTVTATTGAQVAAGAFTVTLSQAALVSVTPNTGFQGDSVSITVTGQNTHFDGSTTFSLGSGITVASTSVESLTQATLSLNIDALAPTGVHTLTATTGGEEVSLPNAFVVQPGTPLILSSSPSGAMQGASFTLTVLGQFTQWVQGATSVSLGNGVSINSVTVTSPASITAAGTVDPLAFTGPRTLTVITGSPVLTLPGAFTVNPGSAAVTALNPNSGLQGQTLNVDITGANTHFQQGVTVASFGPGITVNTLTVSGLTAATANITIAPDASPALNSVTLTTAGEVASAPSAFTIGLGVPAIVSLSPTAGAQGETRDVTVTAVLTHFQTGKTTAACGAGITVNSVTASSATQAVVSVTILPTAALGARDITLSTDLGGGNVETVSRAGAFTVNASGASISSVNPASGRQSDSGLQVTVSGSGTHFDATSVVSLGAGISITQKQVGSVTSLVATLNIDPGAAIGPRNVTVSTGGEVATGTNAFTVNAGLPVLTGVSPASAHPSDTLNVAVVGAYTHFQQNVTAADFGAAITVNSVTVSDATHATVNLTVQAAAGPGARTVTLTTGAEAATLVNAFTVTAGTPVLLSVSPNSGQQGQTLSVTITGQYTHFDAASQLSLGAGITPSNLVATSATQLTASLSIDASAALAARDVTVTTGSEVATLTSGFTVNPPAGGLSGTIYRVDGATKVAGATVRVYQGSPLALLSTVTADAQGAFDLPTLPAGAVTVYANDGESQIGRATGNVPQLSTGSISVSLTGTGNVTVHVRDVKDQAVPGASVTLTVTTFTIPPELASMATRQVTADGSGTALFADFFAGSYHAYASFGGGMAQADDSVANGGSGEITLYLTANEVVGVTLSVLNGTMEAQSLPTGTNEATSAAVSIMNGVIEAASLPPGMNEATSAAVSVMNGVIETPSLPPGMNEATSAAVSIMNGDMGALSLPPGMNEAVSPVVSVGNGSSGTGSPSSKPAASDAAQVNAAASAGPAIAVRIVSPEDGATFVAGQSVTLTAETTAAAVVAFQVNGVEFGRFEKTPYSLTFMAPEGVQELDIRAVAGGAAASARAWVVPDTLTTVRGLVVDEQDRPVAGAKVRLYHRGLKAEIHDFSRPLVEMPALENRPATAVRAVSGLDLMNPQRVFGQYPFGFAYGPDFAVRFTGWLNIETGGEYVFVLRSHQGARLKIGETVVARTPGGAGESIEADGKIKLGAGSVPVEVMYWENVGPAELTLDWIGPDGARRAVDSAAFWAESETLTAVTDAAGEFVIGGAPLAAQQVAVAAEAEQEGVELRGVSGWLNLAQPGPLKVRIAREGSKQEVLK